MLVKVTKGLYMYKPSINHNKPDPMMVHSAYIAMMQVAEKACSSTRVLAAKKSWPDKKS